LPHGFLMWTGSLQPAQDALQESVGVIKLMHESKNT
jgi:acetyl esterase